MVARGRILLAALVLAALSAPAAPAQPPPPTPVPVLPPADPGPPPPMLGPPAAVPYVGPPTPPPPPLFDRPDPGPNGWVDGPSPDEGLLFGVELDFTKPHIKNRVNGTVTFPDGTTAAVQAPGANLDWTAAPSIELGYHFGEDFGALAFTYRFLISEGDANGATLFGDINFRSRLDLNEFDFDYITARYSPGPFWDVQGRVGIRLANAFFDSTAQLGSLAEVRTSNNFIGAGPHFGLDAERRFKVLDGLAAFGRIDGAVLIGQIHQRFHEGFLQADGTTFAGDDTQQGTQSVPMLSVQAGLSYTPPRMDYIHFALGYQFEDWWDVGRLDASQGAFSDQGLFFRGEFDF